MKTLRTSLLIGGFLMGIVLSYGAGVFREAKLIKQSCDNMEENITMIAGSPYVCLTEAQAQALVKQGYMMGLQAKGKEI